MSSRTNSVKEFSEIPRHYLERLYSLRFYEDTDVSYDEYVKRYETIEADGIFYYREDQKSKISDWVKGGIKGLQISDALIIAGNVIKNRRGRTAPHSSYGRENVESEMIMTTYYVGVNSDGTAIISKVPLVRFNGKEDADKKELCYSYNDSQRPPHWIPQDERPKDSKFGHAYIGEYINADKQLVSMLLGKEMTWEEDVMQIVTNFEYTLSKEDDWLDGLADLVDTYPVKQEVITDKNEAIRTEQNG